MNRIDTWRNRLAWRICNWVLAHIADDYYSSYIGVAIRYGMDAVADDFRNGRDPDWFGMNVCPDCGNKRCVGHPEATEGGEA